MFEQIQISKKLKQRLGKAISIVLSAAMLVTALPADLLGGIMSVKAAEPAETMVLDFTELVETEKLTAGDLTADKDLGGFKLTAETAHAATVFTETEPVTVGTHTFTHSLLSNGGGKASASTSYRTISFTTDGPVTVRVYGVSNSTEARAIELRDEATSEAGNYIKLNQEAVTFGAPAVVTFTEIDKAGTYHLCPMKSIRIYRVEVIPVVESDDDALYYDINLEEGLQAGETYDGGLSVLTNMEKKVTDVNKVIDGDTYKPGSVFVKGGVNPKNTSDKVPNAEDPVPVKGSVLVLKAQENGRWKIAVGPAGGKAVWCVEVEGNGEETSGDAGDEPSGDANDEISGNAQKAASGASFNILTNGTSTKADANAGHVYQYDVKKGNTYYFYYAGSNMDIFSVKVDYRQSTPTAWNEVEMPTLTATFNTVEQTVSVVAAGYVDRIKGGDSLTVAMKDASGAVVESYTHCADKAATDKQNFTFKPAESGTYTFVATLNRTGEIGKEVSKELEVDLSLQAPKIMSVANLGVGEDGKGALSISWFPVERATGYKLAIYPEEETAAQADETADRKAAAAPLYGPQNMDGTSADVSGLEVGKYVLVSVQAVRTEGETTEESSAATEWVLVEAEALAFFNLDLEKGLQKGINYPGGFSVLQDMDRKSGSKSVGDKEYSYYVAGADNPSPNKGKIPTTGAVLKLDAQKDGILRIYCSTTDKDLHLIDTLNGKVVKDLLMKEDDEDFFSFSEQTCDMLQVNVEAGHTYYFYGDGTKVNLHEVFVDYRSGELGAWSSVAAPTVVSAEADHTKDTKTNEPANKIKVGFKGNVDPFTGAEIARVEMLDAKGNVVDAKTSYDYSDGNEINYLTFTPDASGTYSFVAKLVREGETDKVSEKYTMEGAFKLYLTMPEISSVTNMGLGEDGKGSLEVVWNEVPEAAAYDVRIIDATDDKKTVANLLQSGTVLKEGTTSELELVLGGLDVSKRVLVAVKAKRVETAEGDVSNEGTKIGFVRAEAGRRWKFSAWGSSIKIAPGQLNDISQSNNGYQENEDGSIRLWSTEGKGKIVPASIDGLAFYYTTIDPETENFTLTADVHVNKWTMSNGQDGFGLMVSDAVGELGNGAAFWNNSYQLLATKIQYTWDTVNDLITTGEDDTFTRYTLKLGLGWLSKEGATQADVANITSGAITKPVNFKTDSNTLETTASTSRKTAEGSYDPYPSGTYNIIGNAVSSTAYSSTEKYESTDRGNGVVTSGKYKSGNVEGTIAEYTDFKMQIRRNNDGYVLTYLKEKTDEDGKIVKDAAGNPELEVIGSKTFYDDDRNNLTLIDKDNIYVGFVAARNADITISNISFTSVAPEKDDPAKGREITKVRPNYQILSSGTSNSEYYELVFRGNADGNLNIINKTDGGEIVALDVNITANKKYTVGTQLLPGNNEFVWSFTPDADYRPSQYEELSSYATETKRFDVNYRVLSGDKIYVSPTGTNAAGAGMTTDNPCDIYTAVQYAAPGQTIILAKGTYPMITIAEQMGIEKKNQLLLIDRGHDGTPEQPIYMVAADDAVGTDRPVLDFTGQSQNKSAFTLAASFWYLKGFDVTKAKNGQKGIQVSGSSNVLEDMRTYKNGNTGIQIARYLGSDSRADWPADNLILNCSSYLNADDGYEDADGFAAKLTVADGNRFVGCIAAYNADDGWDLFAKIETGSIGVVTIENCLAFKNGYLLGSTEDSDGTALAGVAAIDETVKTEFAAGNGNGFKMGGDSMSGYHVLKNSIAFGNRAKGIDSNSCPDIQVYNSTSYANESYNVALYTGTAINTDYYAEGVLSIQDPGKLVNGEWKTERREKDDYKSGAVLLPEDDSIDLKGTQNKSKVYSELNYYVDGGESANSAKLTADKNWFVSTDMEAAIFGKANQAKINRDADGSINMHGFLEMKESTEQLVIPDGVGARLGSTAAGSVIEKSEVISVYAGNVTILRDVTLPDSLAGYSWKYPETAVSVFAGTTSEFIVSAAGRADKTVIVNFIEVTGVELVADKESLIGSTDGADNTITLTAVPVTAPSVALDDVQGATFTYTITESDKLKLQVGKAKDESGKEKDNQVVVSRTSASGEGLAKFTAVMQAKIGNKTTVKKQAIYTFTTRNNGYSFDYDLSGAEEKNGSIILGKVGDSFTLSNLKVTGVGSNTNVKVSTNDTKIIKIAGSTITAADEGTATLTLTASADKTIVKRISVTVCGAAFKTNASMITIDKSLKSGVQITAVACYGKELSGKVSVKSVLKGKNPVAYADNFEVKNLVGNIYTISVKDTEAANNMATGTYNMILQHEVTTGTGETATTTSEEFEAFTVKVVKTTPTVSFKQTKKVNLFYNAGTTGNIGKLKASSKLAGVTLKQVDASKSDYRLDGTAKTGYTIVLKQSAKEKLKKDLDKSITVDVSFDGYKSSCDRTNVKINVATEERAPKLVLEVDNKVLYTQLGMRNTELRILDKTTNTYVTSAVVELTSVGSNKGFTVGKQGGAYVLGAEKSGSAKLSIQDPDWKKAVLASQSITVNKSVPKAIFAVAKLNSSAEYATLEQASAVITLKNATDFDVKNLTLEGANDKAKGLKDCLSYKLGTNVQGQKVLLVSLNKTLPGSYKSGTYNFKATFTLSNKSGKVKLTEQKADVKVTLVPTATITTSQKGSIDLINRTGSSVSVKPTLKNLNGTVVGMSLTEDASNQFDVTWDSSKASAVVQAKEGIELKKGGKYKVTPVFQVLTNGGVVDVAAKSITITPKQSAVKTTPILALETRLSASGVPAKTTVAAKSPAKAEILDMTQLNNTENFAVYYDAQSDTVTARITSTSGLKAGTTYKISMALNLQDAGVNTKPQTITVPVKVLR